MLHALSSSYLTSFKRRGQVLSDARKLAAARMGAAPLKALSTTGEAALLSVTQLMAMMGAHVPRQPQPEAKAILFIKFPYFSCSLHSAEIDNPTSISDICVLVALLP